MYCTKCGFKMEDDVQFCSRCGHNANKSITGPKTTEKKSIKDRLQKMTKKQLLWIIAAVCVLTVVIGLIIYNPFSLENRLMGKKWWTEINVDCEYYDYSDGDGYWVRASCGSIVFCPYGTIRNQYYYTPISSGTAYDMDHEVTKDSIPGYFEWGMGKYGQFYNSGTWELMSGRRLVLGESVYEWSRAESEDTWYLSGNSLRIGDSYYTSKDPNLNIIDDDVPYWCANCGEPGPYTKQCPNCGSKKKTED